MCEISLEEFKSLTTKGKTEIRKDWRKCPLEKWNATTARAYLTECTEAKFKQEYICNSIRQENALMSQFIKQYGRENLKRFIYECMKIYKGNKQYPYPTFGFMYSYMRQQVLTGILREQAEKKERKEALERQNLEKPSDKFETKVGLF
ncbi:hypothetical protein [Bacillus cereus]|uniref:hypothetical protein n=1 Tax=Bacillus cereus TaxID=1396 RepID=UPI000BF62BD0|nr:hypothetical protein [Bacillus cereus]PFQ13501.1 hypothetical protein COK14_09110 [Bacillus cereus]